MIKAKWTTLGTIGAALLASSCCIRPLVFAILGLGAFGAGAVLERYRPVFMGLTLLILGVAFFLTYRKRSGSCADGPCEARGASKWSKITLWLVALPQGDRCHPLSGLAIPAPSDNDHVSALSGHDENG